MPEYASNAKGNAALTTGIIGTALGGINALGGLGAIGGLFGNNNKQQPVVVPPPPPFPPPFGPFPPEPGDRPVTRYEMGLWQRINEQGDAMNLRHRAQPNGQLGGSHPVAHHDIRPVFPVPAG